MPRHGGAQFEWVLFGGGDGLLGPSSSPQRSRCEFSACLAGRAPEGEIQEARKPIDVAGRRGPNQAASAGDCQDPLRRHTA